MALLDAIRAFGRRQAQELCAGPTSPANGSSMWWKFRRHKLAMVGLALLGMFVFFVLLRRVRSAPIRPVERDHQYVAGAPMMPHFFDADGTFPPPALRLWPQGRARHVTLRMKHASTPAEHLADRASSSTASPTSCSGLIPMDIHLFGTRRGLHPPLRHRLHRPRPLLAHHPRDARVARRRVRRASRSPSSWAPRSAARRAISAARSTTSSCGSSSSSARSRRLPLWLALAAAPAARLGAAADLSRHHHHPLAARLDLAGAHGAQQAAGDAARGFRAGGAAFRLLRLPHHPAAPAAVVPQLPDRRHLDRVSRKSCWPKPRSPSSASACASRWKAGACCSSRRRASARSTRRPG